LAIDLDKDLGLSSETTFIGHGGKEVPSKFLIQDQTVTQVEAMRLVFQQKIIIETRI
jgi:hypothetical protein